MRSKEIGAGYVIRAATPADAAAIADHRVAMFRDMGELAEAERPR